jgi:Kdo2-lipid IVA lauroyltransferase/acyltransferase
MIHHYLSFAVIRLLTFPISRLPYSAVHKIGNVLGTLAYYLMPKFRKRALSNLSLAKDLNLSESQIMQYAKESFQNLMITCLEYPKLAREKDISRIAHCENPETADKIMKDGKSVIFFCGHQANWEILFLEGTSRMPGVAIGRPIKNSVLYNWILSIRQKYGGKIITPQNAIREGLRGLKRKSFLGIVGDQGMPNSGYCSSFLGSQAWTSPVPALLSYRTGNPIIVATTLRKSGKYFIHYSDPIWPNPQETQEQEISRMMKEALRYLASSISKTPGQWLWQHNRWKQQTPERLKRAFRHESMCIILPEQKSQFEKIAQHLSAFREIYPSEFITLMIPQAFKTARLIPDAERIIYANEKDILIRDFRFKLIFNFTGHSWIESHFSKLSALKVVNLSDLKKISRVKGNASLSEILKKALCNAG